MARKAVVGMAAFIGADAGLLSAGLAGLLLGGAFPPALLFAVFAYAGAVGAGTITHAATLRPSREAMSTRMACTAWRIYLMMEDDWAAHHDEPKQARPAHLRHAFVSPLFEFEMAIEHAEAVNTAVALDSALMEYQPDLATDVMAPLKSLLAAYFKPKEQLAIATVGWNLFQKSMPKDRHWFQPELITLTKQWYDAILIG